MSRRYQMGIVGGGFGGSLMAMVATRLGYDVVLIERQRHPRFSIGESSTPLTNLLLERLADEYNLPFLKAFTKWGRWKKEKPDIRCGKKRGFSFFHLDGDDAGSSTDDQLLVAASPHDDIADTHWYRPSFDEYLFEQARSLGVEALQGAHISSFAQAGTAWRLEVTQEDGVAEYRVDCLIDASGPRGFLFNALNLRESELCGLQQRGAVFGHFSGFERLSDRWRGRNEAGFDPDDAAVHYLFREGWVWSLRFDDGLTSLGLVLKGDSEKFGVTQQSGQAWVDAVRELPIVGEALAKAKLESPLVKVAKIGFKTPKAVGPGWILLPSSVGSVDPMMSTGIPLNLLGILRLGKILERNRDSWWGLPALQDYSRATIADLDWTATLIGALYDRLGQPFRFNTLTMIYFTAAIYSETLWRLGREKEVPGFMLSGEPVFREKVERLLALDRSVAETDGKLDEGFWRELWRELSAYDLGGLSRLERRWCFPVVDRDFLDSAAKIGSSAEVLQGLLRKAGFYSESVIA